MQSWIDGAGGAPSAPAQHTVGLFTRCHIYLTRLQQNEQRPGARPRRSPARRGALRLPACCLCNWGPRAPLTTPLRRPRPAGRARRPPPAAGRRPGARTRAVLPQQAVRHRGSGRGGLAAGLFGGGAAAATAAAALQSAAGACPHRAAPCLPTRRLRRLRRRRRSRRSLRRRRRPCPARCAAEVLVQVAPAACMAVPGHASWPGVSVHLHECGQCSGNCPSLCCHARAAALCWSAACVNAPGMPRRSAPWNGACAQLHAQLCARSNSTHLPH